ncbi:unnamed protein product, partial [Prunus brigantina]
RQWPEAGVRWWPAKGGRRPESGCGRRWWWPEEGVRQWWPATGGWPVVVID